jgi:hypothetical protein
MKTLKNLTLLSLTLSSGFWFSGCGGGETTTPTEAITATTISGTVADGYLVGAKVCLDKNYNDVCDANEPTTITDSGGHYMFALAETAQIKLPLIVEANASTVDLDTNQPISQEWHFKAMPGNTFISPLSTLVVNEMELNSSLTLTKAMENLKNDLGLDINASVDYVAENKTQAHNAAKIIARSLAKTETTLSSEVPNPDPRLIRLLAAKQVRLQTEAIKTHAIAGDTSFLTDVNTSDLTAQITQVSDYLAALLSPQLQDDLLYMWEEERLARDVYQFMYSKYGSKIFANIAISEQNHIDSVKSMIDKYMVSISSYTDPAIPGIFVNQDLQKLYNTLITQGSISATEAYKVGQLIETTDLTDLDKRLLPSDLPSDIRTVYENLRNGSENHLAAFNKQL